MAKSVLTPEMQALLKKETNIVKTAKNSTSDFKSFAGPVGRYFARLRRITLTANTKSGKPQFNFFLSVLAKCPDSQSNTNIPDQQYAGLSMKNTSYTHATDGGQTAQEAWERAMQNLQAYDVRTDRFGMRRDAAGNEVFDQSVWYIDMCTAIDALNEKPPAVIVDVRETEGKGKNAGKIFKNCNVQETVTEDVVARFAQPSMEVSEDELVPLDDEDNLGPEELATSMEPTWPFDTATAEQLIAQAPDFAALLASTIEMFRPADQGGFGLAPLPVPFDQLTEAEVRMVALAGLTNSQMPGSFACQGPKREQVVVTNTDSLVYSSTGPLTVDQATQVAQTFDEVDEVDELDEVEETPKEDPVIKAQLHIATLDRNGLKLEISQRGGLKMVDDPTNPGQKKRQQFTTKMTDDFLREWLLGLMTGTIPPETVKVESPPFK